MFQVIDMHCDTIPALQWKEVLQLSVRKAGHRIHADRRWLLAQPVRGVSAAKTRYVPCDG